MKSAIYSLKMSFRRPAVWAGTILSILLATGLLFGAFMSIDYANAALVKQCTNTVLVDFMVDIYHTSEGAVSIFNQIASNYNEILSGLKNISHVEKVELMFSTIAWGLELLKENTSSMDILKFDDTPIVPIFLVQRNPEFDGVLINGSLYANCIALGRELARHLNAEVGCQVQIRDTFSSKSHNFTVSATVYFGGEFYDRYYWSTTGAGFYEIITSINPILAGTLVTMPELPRYQNPNYGIIVYFDYWSDFSNLLNETLSIPEKALIAGGLTRIFIVSDRSFIDPLDLSKTRIQIHNLYSNIYKYLQRIIPAENFKISNFLDTMITLLDMQLLGVKLSSLLTLLPILVLSIILSLITNWILVNKRKRELGLLRIRGMGSSQVFLNFLVESIVIGAMAGMLGFIAASGISYLITKTTAGGFAEVIEPSSFLFAICDDYIIPAAITGAILCLTSILYPANKVSKLDLLSSISEYTPEIEAEVKVGKVLLAFMAISFYGILEMLLGMPTLRFILSEVMRGRYFIALLLILYIPVYFVSIFGGPFILAYGCAKLIAAHSDKLSGVLELTSKPFSGDFSRLAVEQFIRKKTRAYKVILIIALTLTFGIYYAIDNATTRMRTQIELEISIGADVKVEFDLPISLPEVESRSINDTIYGVDGVKSASYVINLYVTKNELTEIDQIIILDKFYLDVSYMKEEYIDGISLSKLKEALLDPKAILLPVRYKYIEGCSIGSTINFIIGKEMYNFTIVGYIKWLPGRFNIIELQTTARVAFVGLSVIDRINDLKSHLLVDTILIDVKDSYDEFLVGETIRKDLEKKGLYTYVQVYRKALESANNNWFVTFSYMISDAVFYLSIIMALTSMILTMATSIQERRREIALLRVRGASLRELLGMVLGEAAIITILGYVLGLVLAMVFTYGYLTMAFSAFYIISGAPVEFPPGYIMTIPQGLYLIIGLAFAAFLLSASIPLLVIAKEDISKELRITH
ncbi:MAG: ABC transporter permease [Crenarchaeota archaeon]|nr:ABC transporter permease [Thermoproteota archaeon]